MKKIPKYTSSVLCLLAITWLSLTARFPEVPSIEKIPFYDKWAHFVMYGVFTIVALFDIRKYWVCAVTLLYGGLMELAQANLTTYRSGEWLDFAANCTGVFLGTLTYFIIVRLASKSRS